MSNSTYTKTSARRDMNLCVFTGNLARIDDLKTVNGRDGDTSVLAFSVACSQDSMNGTTVVENTLWLRFTAWGTYAEKLNDFLRKAKRVTVTGALRQPSVYTDKQGKPGASLEFNLKDVYIQEWKEKDAQNDQPRQHTAPEPQEELADIDSDIPF